MKTDTLFYRLFLRWPKLVLELLGLPYDGSSYRFGSEEIKQTAFRLDGLFTPTTDDLSQPLIFAEVQYQPDNHFYDRFFSEITLFLRQHKPMRPWLALVIYPARKVEKLANAAFAPFTTLPQLHRVYLEDYQDCQDLSPTLELVRLIASRETETVALAHNLAARHIELGPDSLDFIETIIVYKLPRLSREEIRTMLALNEIELKQTRFYQEIAEEGRQEGRLEGERILLQRMLVRRFGELPNWVEARLAETDGVQLELWAEKLLFAHELEAVFHG
jgi:predicted transposase/invertase (TIGR01784 family)